MYQSTFYVDYDVKSLAAHIDITRLINTSGNTLAPHSVTSFQQSYLLLIHRETLGCQCKALKDSHLLLESKLVLCFCIAFYLQRLCPLKLLDFLCHNAPRSMLPTYASNHTPRLNVRDTAQQWMAIAAHTVAPPYLLYMVLTQSERRSEEGW